MIDAEDKTQEVDQEVFLNRLARGQVASLQYRLDKLQSNSDAVALGTALLAITVYVLMRQLWALEDRVAALEGLKNATVR